jgi:hypothetical protein
VNNSCAAPFFPCEQTWFSPPKKASRGVEKTTIQAHARCIPPDLRSQPRALDLTNSQRPSASTALYKAFARPKPA